MVTGNVIKEKTEYSWYNDKKCNFEIHTKDALAMSI